MKQTETFITERHFILDKSAEVIRTKISGDVYQFRMWISKEKTYVRKSLKTRDLHIALELGKKEAYKTIGIIDAGRKVKDISISDLCNIFIKEKERDYNLGYITKERVKSIKSYLKHFISFLGKNTSLGSITNQSLYNYAEWRKKIGRAHV